MVITFRKVYSFFRILIFRNAYSDEMRSWVKYNDSEVSKINTPDLFT